MLIEHDSVIQYSAIVCFNVLVWLYQSEVLTITHFSGGFLWKMFVVIIKTKGNSKIL